MQKGDYAHGTFHDTSRPESMYDPSEMSHLDTHMPTPRSHGVSVTSSLADSNLNSALVEYQRGITELLGSTPKHAITAAYASHISTVAAKSVAAAHTPSTPAPAHTTATAAHTTTKTAHTPSTAAAAAHARAAAKLTNCPSRKRNKTANKQHNSNHHRVQLVMLPQVTGTR